MKWWFGFRQVHPKPAGRGVGCGPYESHEAALTARSKEVRNWDAAVSEPFEAEDQAAADQIAEVRTPGKAQ